MGILLTSDLSRPALYRMDGKHNKPCFDKHNRSLLDALYPYRSYCAHGSWCIQMSYNLFGPNGNRNNYSTPLYAHRNKLENIFRHDQRLPASKPSANGSLHSRLKTEHLYDLDL